MPPGSPTRTWPPIWSAQRSGRRAIYYQRLTPNELRAELAECFTVEELVGVRNLPARSIASALRSAGRTLLAFTKGPGPPGRGPLYSGS
jgi:hypothetical protein